MELIRITSSKDPLLEGVPALYESAFPEIARIPSEKFLKLIDICPQLNFNVITDNGSFCGMAIVWKLDQFWYFEYLAVVSEYRNKGIGRQVLKEIFLQTDLPIVGEVEPPVLDIQKRRLAFYGRHGLHVVSENPVVLNGYHSDNRLCLVSTKPLEDSEHIQCEIINKVYAVMRSI